MSVTEHRRNVRVQEKEVNTKKEKAPINKFNLISKIIMGVFTALVLTVFGLLIFLNVLPMKYLIPLFVVALGLNVAGVIIVFKIKNDLKLRFIITVIAAVGALILGFVNAKLFRTVSFLKGMETETVNSKTYSVVVLKDSKFEKMEDLQYKILLYYACVYCFFAV